MPAFLSLLLLVLLTTGCGYQPLGRGAGLPEGVETVYIPVFENRTLEPFLENQITRDVIEEFSRREGVRVLAAPQTADARLEGEITAFQAAPLSFGPEDRIGQYRVRVTIAVTLRRTDTGLVLWRGQLDWSEQYPTAADKSVQEDNEQAAIRVISRRLAENLYMRLHDNF
ncbi:LPS assembly lipoprotein LptE [Geoalkalibacter halelectricus]|uniref:LPS assembly lipoprotein LptE n=1 Tax=Geoalkalibacter halelectricus TaxID=2847045 RepID=A0ABY5ZRD8_9BACT|nr:LptE family protein [Geoalkalibacter halelectricus]MDO3380041.1 LPS assembly lipoprotein LptE [Geoalkalibacter halelectricus]UWZ80435.1 LPS assembly lipoprotein LptE [Geoalkalibacter halelectricus]